MTDRTTKTLLLAIALGLWLHVIHDWTVPVQAQTIPLRESNALSAIATELHAIAWGTCQNRKLC
jgi:hypothetical protein